MFITRVFQSIREVPASSPNSGRSSFHTSPRSSEQFRRSFFATLTPAGDDRLRESRLTHNEVIRVVLTRRLTDTQLAKLGEIWDQVRDPAVGDTYK